MHCFHCILDCSQPIPSITAVSQFIYIHIGITAYLGVFNLILFLPCFSLQSPDFDPEEDDPTVSVTWKNLSLHQKIIQSIYINTL